jgi:hypothetical protein
VEVRAGNFARVVVGPERPGTTGWMGLRQGSVHIGCVYRVPGPVLGSG